MIPCGPQHAAQALVFRLSRDVSRVRTGGPRKSSRLSRDRTVTSEFQRGYEALAPRGCKGSRPGQMLTVRGAFGGPSGPNAAAAASRGG